MTPDIGCWVEALPIDQGGYAHNDDPDIPSPYAGLVIDHGTTNDGEITVTIIESWRREIRYHTLPTTALRPGPQPHGWQINTRTIRGVLQTVIDDMRRNPTKHLHAYTTLARILEQKTPGAHP